MTKRFILSIALVVVSLSSVCFAADSADVASKDVTALTPAERLAQTQGIPLEQAREMLLAAGLDPDTIPTTHAARAGYDPDEVVEKQFVTVWRNDPDHQRMINVYQGIGKFKPGDRKYLFASGQRTLPHTDVNGHSDSSAVNGSAFKGPKFGVDGLAVFSQATGFCKDKYGKVRKAWFNILIDYRQPNVKEGVEIAEKDLVKFVNAHGVWNCREAFDSSTASYQAMTADEWFDQERLYAAWVNDKGGDPSFFMFHKAQPGETVDLQALHQRGIKEGLYTSFSEIWGGSDEVPAKPQFPAKKTAKKAKRK